MRACSWAPISPLTAQGSRKRPLIPLDDALSAGGFQVAAELRGFVGRAEWTNHGSVVDPLVAQIRTLDHGAVRSQHRGELALQGLVGSLRVGLISLRGNLNQIPASGCGAAGCGLRRDLNRVRGCPPGTRFGSSRRWSALRRQ